MITVLDLSLVPKLHAVFVSCNHPVFCRGYSWKKMKALLEAEAVSKVAVKELLKKLFSISQELSGIIFIH
jgi:hypothetical protein